MIVPVACIRTGYDMKLNHEAYYMTCVCLEPGRRVLSAETRRLSAAASDSFRIEFFVADQDTVVDLPLYDFVERTMYCITLGESSSIGRDPFGTLGRREEMSPPRSGI